MSIARKKSKIVYSNRLQTIRLVNTVNLSNFNDVIINTLEKIMKTCSNIVVEKNREEVPRMINSKGGRKLLQKVVVIIGVIIILMTSSNLTEVVAPITGINMLPNIITYIGLGFKPVSKSEKNVFLEKDMRKPLSKQEIRDLIKNAKQGIICPKQNPLKERLKSNMSLKEQKANSDRFNQTQNVAVTPNEPSAREEDGK